MAASIKIPATFTARDRFSPAVKRMSASVQGFSNRASVGIARVEHRFNRLMRPLTALQRQLGGFGLGVGLFALTAGIGNAINIFKDFEQANANVASVLGITTSETKDLQEDAKRLGATTAFTASQVAGLQTEYAKLGLSQTEILNATEATLDLAAAAGADLSEAAAIAGGTVKAFGLDATETGRVTDVMAKSFSSSALDLEKFRESMKIVAPVAKSAGVSIEEATAMIGSLADAGVSGSMAGTALRRIINEISEDGKPFAESFAEATKQGLNLASAEKLVGKNAQSALLVLSEAQDKTKGLASSLENAGGAAKEMADKQLDTLDGSLTKLSSAYEGFILSLDDGSGGLAVFIRRVIDVTTEVLALMAGVADAKNTLDGKALAIRENAETALFLLKGIGLLIGAIITFKVLLIASKIALAAYSVVMGIHAAITQTSRRRVIGNTVAQGAYRTMMLISAVAMKGYAAAQWLVNAAMSANPIGLIIIGIAALIALVALIIKKYDDWGASLALLLGPFGMIINVIQSFRRNWEMVKDAFKTGGILGGLKAIGKVLIDALLMPLEQLLNLISKVPGMGDLAGNAAAKIASIRDNLGVDTGRDDVEEEVLPTTNQASNEQLIERTNNSNVNLNIRDRGGNVETVDQDGNPISINLSRGIGAFAT